MPPEDEDFVATVLALADLTNCLLQAWPFKALTLEAAARYIFDLRRRPLYLAAAVVVVVFFFFFFFSSAETPQKIALRKGRRHFTPTPAAAAAAGGRRVAAENPSPGPALGFFRSDGECGGASAPPPAGLPVLSLRALSRTDSLRLSRRERRGGWRGLGRRERRVGRQREEEEEEEDEQAQV